MVKKRNESVSIEEQNRIRPFFVRYKGSFTICCFVETFFIIVVVSAILSATFRDADYNAWWIGLLVIIAVTMTILGVIGYASRVRCEACGKIVSPFISDHVCYKSMPKKLDLKAIVEKSIKIEMVKDIVSKLSKFLTDAREIEAIESNFFSYYKFNIIEDYKYCLIAMGSILEFLLISYCTVNNIQPEPFNGKSGTDFANYLEAAINQNILGEKSRWKIVQSTLRNFRNYVHIQKETKEDRIDKSWFDTMEPVFNGLIQALIK